MHPCNHAPMQSCIHAISPLLTPYFYALVAKVIFHYSFLIFHCPRYWLTIEYRIAQGIPPINNTRGQRELMIDNSLFYTLQSTINNPYRLPISDFCLTISKTYISPLRGLGVLAVDSCYKYITPNGVCLFLQFSKWQNDIYYEITSNTPLSS